MTQPLAHPSRGRRGSALRAFLAAVLLATAAAGCDGDGPAGPLVVPGPPTAPPEPPPADAMRLRTWSRYIASDGDRARNTYGYDAAGRLVRVDFEANDRHDTPLVHRRYVTLEYDGSRLTGLEEYVRLQGEWYHVSHQRYAYDGLGYLTGVTYESLEGDGGVSTRTATLRYDGRGRLVEEAVADEVSAYRYDAADVPLSMEKRWTDGTVFHVTYRHDRRRNPFFRRPALWAASVFVLPYPTEVLSPHNLTREELRVGADPVVVSYSTLEYEYDGAGRPLQAVQTLVNAYDPALPRTVVQVDYGYEPVPGS